MLNSGSKRTESNSALTSRTSNNRCIVVTGHFPLRGSGLPSYCGMLRGSEALWPSTAMHGGRLLVQSLDVEPGARPVSTLALGQFVRWRERRCQYRCWRQQRFPGAVPLEGGEG